MILLIILVCVVLYGVVAAFDAYILVEHVPTVIADPTNFWAWFWIAIAAIVTMIATRASKS